MQSEVTQLGVLSAPNTDQLNADDLLIGARIFTITKITRGKGNGSGKGDQPINIHLAEHPHPWRPCKTVRRLLMQAWGDNPTKWPDGAQVELYRDASVTFGGDTTGGVRVRRMSHIDAPTIEHLSTATRGKRVTWRIGRLDATPPTAKKPADSAPMLKAFAALGISVERLSAKLSRPVLAEWTSEQLADARKLYATIKADPAKLAEEFPPPEVVEDDWSADETPNDQAGELTALDRLAIDIGDIEDSQGAPTDANERKAWRGSHGCTFDFARATETQLRAYLARLNGGGK